MNNIATLSISSRIPYEPYYFYQQYLRSCQRQKITPTFLTLDGGWTGLMTKPRSLLAWIEQNGAEFEHISFTDSWDILWVTGTEELLEKFAGINTGVVFNAETSCFPRGDLADQFPLSPTIYRFLNSGFFIGKTEVVRQMLLDMKADGGFPSDGMKDGAKFEPNDQEFYSLWFLKNQDKAKLDYNTELCHSLHNAPEDALVFDTTEKRPRSLHHGTLPCAFHGNGSGKEWLKNVITWMHY